MNPIFPISSSLRLQVFPPQIRIIGELEGSKLALLGFGVLITFEHLIDAQDPLEELDVHVAEEQAPQPFDQEPGSPHRAVQRLLLPPLKPKELGLLECPSWVICIRVHQVHLGHIQAYPGSYAFGSIPVTFRSILVHAFGSISVIQVYPGSCIPVYPGHIQRGKLSVPHFGPPASYMRISDQSPGYYSSPGNQRRTCGHGVINNRRRAGSIRKAEESSRKNLQCQSDQRHVRAHFRGIPHKSGHPDLSRTPFLTGLAGPAPLTRLLEGRFSGSKRPRRTFGAHSQKTETAAIPEHLKTFREHLENPDHESLGLPGLTVFSRGQRADDLPRGGRVTETNIKMHGEQSGTRDTQFHSECPNRAKPTLEAPSRPNDRSDDAWRY
ncbi:hypothetical protein CRG98_000758 [Punica granatum]|uniref:Uncharacterized protein n=1 Tax=Punica granatum TaxID=22663 RepID=A0A2I0LDZ2_PUNGR|nr:hypothetical protein CRG98_000758 [Punica granatum]